MQTASSQGVEETVWIVYSPIALPSQMIQHDVEAGGHNAPAATPRPKRGSDFTRPF